MLLYVCLIAVPVAAAGAIACSGGGETGDCSVDKCPETHYCDHRTKKCVANVICTKPAQCEGGKCVQGECCGGGKACPSDKEQDKEQPPADGGTADTGPPKDSGPDVVPEPPKCGGATICRTNDDCSGAGERCDKDGCCTDACTKVEDCGPKFDCAADCTGRKFACLAKRCQRLPCECAKDEKCDTSDTKKCVAFCQKPKCDGTTCPAGKAPDPDANCKCDLDLIEACGGCQKDAECGPGNKCIKERLGNYCAANCCTKACASGYRCDTRVGDGGRFCLPSSGKCPCQGLQCATGTRCCPGKEDRCRECCSAKDCPPAGNPKATFCHNVTYRCVEACEGVVCNDPEKCDPADGKCKCFGKVCPTGQTCWFNYGCHGGGTKTCSTSQSCCPHNKAAPACNYSSYCCQQQCKNYCRYGNCY